MKARIERERIPPGEDSRFHLKLGRGSLSDVEFTAQLEQLAHGAAQPVRTYAFDPLGPRRVGRVRAPRGRRTPSGSARPTCCANALATIATC